MNRLSKTDSQRGKGVPRTYAPSIRAAGTCAPAAGTAGTRAQARTTGVPQDAGVPRMGACPVGGSWPMSSPSQGLYPLGGFSNFLRSNPFANHPNGNENFHFVGAGMSQSTVPPIDLGATRTPSPAQQTQDIVDDLDAQEDETINVDDDSRTEKRLNWTVPDDIRLACAWFCRSGFSPIHKCTVAMRQLAYGGSADQLDEYLNMGESTGVECLKKFVQGVIAVYGEEYLRRPTVQDVERLLQISERRGFPGMLGSIDCMHWHWEKCPYAWKGQYTRGDHGVPTIILEAVASHDRWIWHAFFGVAGSNNDINVLSHSDLFVKELRGEAPQVQYFVNGRQYTRGYYLVDGIYPDWAVFVKSIRAPQSAEHKLYAEHQEGERKDVECAFGILQSRFGILRRPARLYEQGDLENIMLACIILHNMIIEDEKDIEDDLFDLNEEATTSTVQPSTITHAHDPVMEEVIQRNTEICDREAHRQLQSDLIDHIWQKFGNQTN